MLFPVEAELNCGINLSNALLDYLGQTLQEEATRDHWQMRKSQQGRDMKYFWS